MYSRDGRYYRYGIEIVDTYESIDTFDTRKNLGLRCFWLKDYFLRQVRAGDLVSIHRNRQKSKNVDMMLLLKTKTCS